MELICITCGNITTDWWMGECPSCIAAAKYDAERKIAALTAERDQLSERLRLAEAKVSESIKMVSEVESEYNRKTNNLIERHAAQLATERERGREEMREMAAIAGHEAIRSYRMNYLVDEEGDGAELSDVLANVLGDSDIGRALEELTLIGDHIYNAIRTLPTKEEK